jgi:hypothetical protein
MGPTAMSDRLSEVSTIVMASISKTPLVESLSSMPSTEDSAQAGSPGLLALDVAGGKYFEATEGPRDADLLTVSESGFELEEESASVLESESQLQDVQPSIVEEVSDALLVSTEAALEVQSEETMYDPTVDMQESSDIPLEAEAASEGEADLEEVNEEFPESSEILSGGTELVFEEETSADEMLDETSEFPIDDVVAATADSSLPSEDTGFDVSTPDQLEQEEDNTDLHHGDGIKSMSQTDPALDEVNDLVTPALSQVESLEKSLSSSMLQATLPQCSAHLVDHEVINMVSTMTDDE